MVISASSSSSSSTTNHPTKASKVHKESTRYPRTNLWKRPWPARVARSRKADKGRRGRGGASRPWKVVQPRARFTKATSHENFAISAFHIDKKTLSRWLSNGNPACRGFSSSPAWTWLGDSGRISGSRYRESRGILLTHYIHSSKHKALRKLRCCVTWVVLRHPVLVAQKDCLRTQGVAHWKKMIGGVASKWKKKKNSTTTRPDSRYAKFVTLLA